MILLTLYQHRYDIIGICVAIVVLGILIQTYVYATSFLTFIEVIAGIFGGLMIAATLFLSLNPEARLVSSVYDISNQPPEVTAAQIQEAIHEAAPSIQPKAFQQLEELAVYNPEPPAHAPVKQQALAQESVQPPVEQQVEPQERFDNIAF